MSRGARLIKLTANYLPRPPEHSRECDGAVKVPVEKQLGHGLLGILKTREGAGLNADSKAGWTREKPCSGALDLGTGILSQAPCRTWALEYLKAKVKELQDSKLVADLDYVRGDSATKALICLKESPKGRDLKKLVGVSEARQIVIEMFNRIPLKAY